MPETGFEANLTALSLLAEALTVPSTLDEALRHIARMTGKLMETEQTVLLLRDEERRELIVRTAVGIGGRNLREGHPIVLPDRLKSIFWRMRSLHQINWVDSGIDHIGFPILLVPLVMKGEHVGLLVTGKCRLQTQGFSPIRRRLFALVAVFASLVLENAKVYDFLRQQFAQRSRELIEANRREADGRDEAEHLMASSISDPNKVVRLLARSFYKELVRAGFDPGHVTVAAAQILECITNEPTTAPRK